MRTIALIIIHHSANRQGSISWTVDIDRLHHSLDWKGCEYHFVIPTDGTIKTDGPLEQVDAHRKNHDRYSTRVCYIGGLANDGKTPMDARTEAQQEASQSLLHELHQRFPKALIAGHRDLDLSKSCPRSNVVNEFFD